VAATQDRVCPCGRRRVEKRKDDAVGVGRACLVGFATPGRGERAWVDCSGAKARDRSKADDLRDEQMEEMTGRDGSLAQHCVETCAEVGGGPSDGMAET
jgi:hypothetical protein